MGDHRAVVLRRIIRSAVSLSRRIVLVVKRDGLLEHNIRCARLQPFNLLEIDDSLARAVLASNNVFPYDIANRRNLLAINLLQLTLKPVLHTRYQVVVGDGVLNVQTSSDILRLHGHRSVCRRLLTIDRNLGSDLALRVRRNRLEGLIDGDDLCGVVRVRVISHKLLSTEVVEVETLEYDSVAVLDLVGPRNLHGDGAGNRIGE